jgi:TonB family protein
VAITRGDWGVLEFGDVELFFQFVRPEVIIGRKPAMDMEGPAVSATLACLFVVGTFFTTAQFFWDPTGSITQNKVDRRFLKVDVNITQEKDEQLLEIGEEDDSVGKRAEGEEGKFGDPDKDPTLESKVPRRDGQMVSKIDPKKIGLADMLSSKMASSGAISSILSDADAFDNRMAVAMAGTGSELVVGYGAGGMGFKGTGPGGGGTGGYGRIHGLGRVDTGGGMGMRAGLGHKKAANVGKISLGGMQGSGFCQRNNIQQVVMMRAGAIRACYEAQLQIHEGLAGKIAVRWTINLEGGVEGASVTENTMGNTAVQECVLRAIRNMRFAKPEGGVCVVAWPFVFNPG